MWSPAKMHWSGLALHSTRAENQVLDKGKIMKISAISILFLFTLCMHSEAYSAWYLTQPQGMSTEEKIDDKKLEFMLGNISCGVTGVKLITDPDGNKLEIRELYCNTDTEIRVSVMANCRKNVNFPTVVLQLQRGSNSYLPSLSCH